ncbi:MAG: GNAT family N-acetyltransferase [Myxococcales bacterium]|nr:GNAT family N-acetyltransferase [Myxococcales bacterium]
MSLVVRPITAADAPRLVGLFEAVGSTCYCRYLHFAGDKNDWLARTALEPEQNRRELEDGLATGTEDVRGLVAEEGGRIVGWAKLTRSTEVPKAYAQRYYVGLPVLREDREGTLLLGCFLVDPAFRRKGVSRALVRGALAEAARRGARAVEALPRALPPPARDEELWTGTIGALESEGFLRVGGDDNYPVLRASLVAAEPR